MWRQQALEYSADAAAAPLAYIRPCSMSGPGREGTSLIKHFRGMQERKADRGCWCKQNNHIPFRVKRMVRRERWVGGRRRTGTCRRCKQSHSFHYIFPKRGRGRDCLNTDRPYEARLITILYSRRFLRLPDSRTIVFGRLQSYSTALLGRSTPRDGWQLLSNRCSAGETRTCM